jgi:hypothetical protein
VHKVNKTVQPFRVGHIPAHLTCHLATKTAEIWNNAVQKTEGKDRQSVWQTDYSPQHQKDTTGKVINRCLQSPDLVKRVVSLFPTECFGVKKVLIFSSGESCGWVAPLALEMGFNCICTEPDPTQYEALVSRLYEGLPAATAKLRAIREKSELKEKESQVDKTRQASHQEQVLEEKKRFMDVGLSPEDAESKAEIYVSNREQEEERAKKNDEDDEPPTPPTPPSPLPAVPEEESDTLDGLFCPNCNQLLTEGHQCETTPVGAGIRAFRSRFGETIDRAKEIVGESKALRGSSTPGNRVITAEDYDWQLEPVFHSTPGASVGGTPMGGFGFQYAPGALPFVPYPGPYPGFRAPTPWVTPQFPGYVRTFFFICYLLSDCRAPHFLLISALACHGVLHRSSQDTYVLFFTFCYLLSDCRAAHFLVVPIVTWGTPTTHRQMQVLLSIQSMCATCYI